MKSLLFLRYQSTVCWFLGGALVALSLLVSPTLQAYETNFNFNASTDAGWERWLPEFYGVNDGSGNFTNGVNLPTITFTTNSSSAGNMAYFFHSGTTNSSLTAAPKLGSIITNGPSLTNFTMTGEIFHWTNGQGQDFGLIGRVQLPLPPVNAPNTESVTNTANPSGLVMLYCNSRSAKNHNAAQPNGSSDNLRINWLTPSGDAELHNNAIFNGPGVAGHTNASDDNGFHIEGSSFSPDATNGHYRLILTVNSNDVTGQLVDLSTGLPMSFRPGETWWYHRDHATNILRTSFMEVFYTNAMSSEDYVTVYDPTKNTNLTQYINVGGAYGFVAAFGNAGGQGPTPGDYSKGQPIDPKFDNFAIVPGVVTLQSAATVNGTYTQDSAVGIEVSPKRITIPVNGSTRFYRINWIGADHTPQITSIKPGATVSVVTGGPVTGGWTNEFGRPIGTVSAPVTNVVKTMVVTYN